VYAAFQDLVGHQGLVCDLAKRSVWRRVPDDEPGKKATPDDSAQLRKVDLLLRRGAVGVLGAGAVGAADQALDL
jgi:hypothetical protein